MKNAEYWADRFTALDDLTFKKSEKYARNLQKQFDAASKKLSKDTAYWYGKLALNNEISYSAAKKLLKADELSEFHWTVDEYIKYGKQAGLDPEWIKQLENASAKVHISRLEQMQTDMRQTVEGLYKEYETGVGSFLEGVTTTSYYHTAYEVAKGTGVGVNLHRLDKDTVSDFLTRPWCKDGKVFSDRIWARKNDLLQELNTALAQNLITGADPQKTIDKIAERFGVEKRAAGRLIMTETAAIQNEARQKCMKDLDIEEFEFVATLDSHTSVLCRGMDGQHFPMSQFTIGLNAPPLHCNCRSCTVPYFNDEFTKDETRAAREAGDTGYKTTTAKSYKNWARQVQKEYGNLYKIPGDWEYKDWYEAVIEKQCEGLMKMNLQFLAEKPTTNCMDVSMPEGRVNLESTNTLKEYLSTATPNSHDVEESYSCYKNGRDYVVDGHSVIFDPSPNERRVADVIKSKLGGRIQLMPKVNDPPKVRIADYLWRGIPYDLKTIEQSASKNYIENVVGDHFGQANRFIFDNSSHVISNEDLIKQAEIAFTRPTKRYLEEIMIIDGDEIITILSRKK